MEPFLLSNVFLLDLNLNVTTTAIQPKQSSHGSGLRGHDAACRCDVAGEFLLDYLGAILIILIMITTESSFATDL